MKIKENKDIWVNDFNQNTVKEFYEDFMDWESSPFLDVIPVYLNSYGGEVYSLIAMRDLIKSSTKPVSTIALGIAASCGASLLAAGTKGMRFASPDTKILIHQVSGGIFGKNSDIQAGSEQIKDLNEMILNNLSEDTGIPVSKFKAEIQKRNNADWVMNTEEALKWKIIDAIAIPRNVFPQYKANLEIFMDPKTAKKYFDLKKKPKPKGYKI
jgi:ATP-dependent Clp protease, protease subunit